MLVKKEILTLSIGKMFILLGLALFLLSACGSNNEQESSGNYDSYTAEEYQMSLVGTDGQQVDVFASPEKELHLYFTGVG